ncbi:MAG: SBBP repeat-containing protein [Paludibacteraceae bacterium]|nr:SBBP repeat-containing protein [Paludibacteraceae bacterium]
MKKSIIFVALFLSIQLMLQAKNTVNPSSGLQFTSAGHILLFQKGGITVASASHAMNVKFVNARQVNPQGLDSSVTTQATQPLPSSLPVSGAVAAAPDTSLQGFKPGGMDRAAPLSQVTYSQLWKGVTVIYKASTGGVYESTYQLSPVGNSTNVGRIRLQYSRPISLDNDGNLVIHYPMGTLTESAPVAWQTIDGKRVPVPVAYKLYSRNRVGFTLGACKAGVPVTIDPTLSWNTFLGGTGGDFCQGIVLDASGNVYVCGYSNATWGSPIRAYTGYKDGFVAKLTSTGTLSWNTFLGGTGNDYCQGIASDASGNVYVCGYSDDTWGTPIQAFTGSGTGYKDGFVAKLTSTGTLNWNTFLGGGAGDDFCQGIASDASANVYVCGYSTATWGLPIRAYTSNYDGFVAKFTSAGTLSWNTFLGGTGTDFCYGIAMDASANVYVCGTTNTTWGSPIRAYTGGFDGFVAKLTSAGALSWNTFLGGTGYDECIGIASDASANVYVCGTTNTTWGSPIRAYTCCGNGFVAKLTSTGTLSWNTFLGSGSSDYCNGIVLDASANVYVCGHSGVTWGAPTWAYSGGTDGFVAQLSSAGALSWNAFLGGVGTDDCYGIAMNASANVYVCGTTTATWGSPIRAYASDVDAFVAKILTPPALTTQAATAVNATTATLNGTITSFGSTSSATAYGFCYSSTNAIPTIADVLVNLGATSTTGAYSSPLTSLTPATTYYVRAYATNSYGTSYGVVQPFTTLSANVQVWSGGTLQAGYITLQAAFAAINAGTHKTGALDVKILGSTTETGTAVLYQSGYNSTSSYTSIHVYPTASGLSITGTLALPLIDINGANNVVIDGRVNATGNTKGLTISNTSTSGTAGTSTLRFIHDASNNTVKYCTLKGSSMDGSGGVIFFSTGTATGNMNDTIDSNDITTADDSNRPTYTLYSAGSASYLNTAIVISNNNIYNCLSKTANSYAIHFASNSTACIITGNSIYETTSFAPATAVLYRLIHMAGCTSQKVIGNYLGGSGPQCTGTWVKTNSNASTLYGISFNGSLNSVQGNTISHFDWSNSSASSPSFYGIYNTTTADITGNIIGATSGLGAIKITNAGGGFLYGISSNGGTVSNNTVGSLEAASSVSTSGTGFYGIYAGLSTTNTLTISGNLIGHASQVNSIYCSSASSTSAQTLYGIYCSGTGTGLVTISNNVIANLNNGTTNTAPSIAGFVTGVFCNSIAATVTNNIIHNLTVASADTVSSSNASAIGICFNNQLYNNTATGNTIYNISNTYASFVGHIMGVYFIGSTGANRVSGNYIYGVTVSPTSAGATVYGIKMSGYGNTTYANNIINLGGNTASTMYGIFGYGRISVDSSKVYHNTVYIGGSPTSTTYKSYALYSNVSVNIRNVRNNLFINARSTVGGSSLHYAAYFNSGSSTTLTLNNNDYRATGTGGVLGYYNSANVTSVPLISGQDANSMNVDPKFVSAGGSTARSYIPYNLAILGASIPAITTDYAGNIRSTTAPTMGAYEFTPPTVTTQAVSNIKTYTATGNGTIIDLGIPDSVTTYGICWSESPNTTPTTSDHFIAKGNTKSLGTFTGAMAGLGIKKKYYVRAYATNLIGTGYGNAVTFDNYNRWMGSTSTDWNTALNWTNDTIPGVGDDIYIHSTPQNNCVLDQDRTIDSLTNPQSTYRVVTNGHTLTVKGSLELSNGGQIDASTSGSNMIFAGSVAQSIPTGAFYNNQVYNLTVNNPNNVTLSGTLSLLGTLTTPSGLLDAVSQSPTVSYAGTAVQTIEKGTYLNEQIYNLSIANASGVTDNDSLTITNAMSINTGALLTLPPAKALTANGMLTNNAGTGGFVIGSSSVGTGSLIHATDNVPATVNRYIGGVADTWHFLSTPVAAQNIAGSWLPTGSHPGSVGYDLFVWDEPSSCWIYNLNTEVFPTWSSVHPQSYFVPGRGYLYSVQENTPTKTFVGNLNNGTVTYAITTSGTGTYQGFNLIGNPYPSSIDWKVDVGFSRGMLYMNGSGYDFWTWNSTKGNYGVFNSADPNNDGTNNVSRYIAPMQAFFVRATTAGTFSFNNAARVHTGANVWLKSQTLRNTENRLRVTVDSEANIGGDEVKIGFGYPSNENGAMKMFSSVKQAPSLYLKNNNESYSTRYMTDTTENHSAPLSFKAGKEGNYSLTCKYDASVVGTLYLEDRLAGTVVGLSDGESYAFKSAIDDNSDRFVLHFGSVRETSYLNFNAKVYATSHNLIIDLSNVSGTYDAGIRDVSGQVVYRKTMSGGDKFTYPFNAHGIYIVTLQGSGISKGYKVVY